MRSSAETGCVDGLERVHRRVRFSACALVALLATSCEPSEPLPLTGLGAAPGVPVSTSDEPAPEGAPDVPALVAKVKPLVVNVTVELAGRSTRLGPLTPYPPPPPGRGLGPVPGPELWYGMSDQGPQHLARGSGFIIDSAGRIVTNAHVVEGAERVRVTLYDQRDYRARVRGRDRLHDVAVLELDGATDLPVAKLGSSESLKVGEYVVAVGNPFGLGHTVTLGIVSAKSRSIGAGPFNDFLQTDAAINPGNSGGPLFDMRGEVVGINAAVAAQGSGIGFAITIGEVREILTELIAKGYVNHGRLGVSVQPIDWPLARSLGLERPEGALVTEIRPGSPIEAAGLRIGDVIVAADGHRILQWQELPRLIAHRAPGTHVTLDVVRDRKPLTVEALVEQLERPSVEPPRPALVERAEDLGIQVEEAHGGGVRVRRVVPGSLAYGVLAEGDIVVEMNGAPVVRTADFERIVRAAPSRSTVLFKLRREGRTRFAAIDIP